jgi:hypothetical protein
MAVTGPVEKTKVKENTKRTQHPIQAMRQSQLFVATAGTLLDVVGCYSYKNSILSPYGSMANTSIN